MKTQPGKPTILAFAPGLWNWPTVHGETRYHLWSLAARGWSVFYVEPPRKWRTRPVEWKAPDRPFRALGPAFTLPFAPRFVPGNWLATRWRDVSARQLAAQALAWMDRTSAVPEMLWFGAPWHGALIPHLPPGLPRAYFMYDDLPSSPALSAAVARRLWGWEKDLLEEVDLGLFTSEPIGARRQPFVKASLVVENCVSEDFLPENRGTLSAATQKLVGRLEAIPRPRLVYTGVVDLRLDPGIYRAILDGLPSAHLVLIGSIGVQADRQFINFLENHPRAHLLGAYPYGALPHLMPLADVLLLAHRRHPFTEAMYPSKLNEYLASGRPIAAIDLPEIVRTVRESGCNDLVYTSSTPEEFVGACRTALAENDADLPARRLGIARAHTFGSGADRVEGALLSLVAEE